VKIEADAFSASAFRLNGFTYLGDCQRFLGFHLRATLDRMPVFAPNNTY
jgi:hypothetical protein